MIGTSDVYFVIDESTDACQRSVLNILVKKLDGNPSKPMLLKVTQLEATNNKTVAQVFSKILTLIQIFIILVLTY